MLVWSSPWWLLALTVIPLIWLLHRLTAHGPTIAVSSLLFWKPFAAPAKSRQSSAKTDPLWLLRALIATLMILSAAAPRWIDDSLHVIDVWFDDSFSMQTLETGRGRAQLGIEALNDKLQTLDSVRAKIHSLTDPLHPTLLLESGSKQNWPERLNRWLKIGDTPLAPPLASDITGRSEHWLVTDGADAGLNEWLKSAKLNQLIQPGKVSDNSAITLLSIRPSLKNPKIWSGVIRLDHFGLHAEQRSVDLLSGNDLLKHWNLTLPPDQNQHIEFEISHDQIRNQPLLAQFSAADALPEDDRMSLLIDEPIPTQIYGNCPRPLVAAIKAHPFIDSEISESTHAELAIVCGDETADQSGSMIRFHQAAESRKLDAMPSWLPATGNLNKLNLPQQHLAYFQRESSPGGVPLLVAEQIPLITLSETPQRTLDCYIDMGAAEFYKQAEYPLLFAGLVDLAVDKAVLENIRTTSRMADESRVAPLSIQLPPQTIAVEDGLNMFDITPYLIGAAILLLLLDGWLSRKTR